MKTATIEHEVQELVSHAETIKNDSERTFEKEWMPGDVAAQGDLNIVCLKSMPKSAKRRANRQMADGNTMGSRHVVESGECFDADANELASMVKDATGHIIDARYMGPVFCGPAELRHPEHGDQVWTEPCVNVVTYQRVWDSEQRERRAAD